MGKKDASLTVRIEQQRKDRLEEIAAEYDWSTANIVARLVTYYDTLEEMRASYQELVEADADEEEIAAHWESVERFIEGGLLCGRLPDEVDRDEIMGLKALQGGWEK